MLKVHSSIKEPFSKILDIWSLLAPPCILTKISRLFCKFQFCKVFTFKWLNSHGFQFVSAFHVLVNQESHHNINSIILTSFVVGNTSNFWSVKLYLKFWCDFILLLQSFVLEWLQFEILVKNASLLSGKLFLYFEFFCALWILLFEPWLFWLIIPSMIHL